MKPKTQRLILIGLGLSGLGLAIFLILSSFQDALIFYFIPSDLQRKSLSPQQRIRVGGFVEKGSVRYERENVTFHISDHKVVLKVNYKGLLPDLFREGQGVVAEGFLVTPDKFQAESVLAKHDENYMPKEVADQLKKEGLWQDAQ